jgi:hypothetical protein
MIGSSEAIDLTALRPEQGFRLGKFGELLGRREAFRLARFGDHNFLAGGGTVDQLGQVRLRIVEIDSVCHYSGFDTSHELTILTNRC